MTLSDLLTFLSVLSGCKPFCDEEENRLKKKFADYFRRREYSRMSFSPHKSPKMAKINADLSPVASTKGIDSRSKSPMFC